MIIREKYGVQVDVYFPMIKRAVVDFAVSADWTPASGDTKISKDGGATATTTNQPSAIAMGNTAYWKLTLSATEMQAARIVVTIADSATKAVEDQMILIHTFGNASAQLPPDLSDVVRLGLTSLPNAVVNSTGGIFAEVIRSSTAQAGAAGTITLDASASAVNDFYAGSIVYILSGTGAGQSRLISDYVGSTKVASVSPNWYTNPDNTSVFVIIPSHALGLISTDATALNNLKAMFDGTGYAGGTIRLKIDINIKKNTAYSGFQFFMVDSLDNVTGKTGLTVTATRSIDGAAFGACANAVSEVGSGLYKIDLAAADLNGNSITLKLVGAGALTTIISIVTQP